MSGTSSLDHNPKEKTLESQEQCSHTQKWPTSVLEIAVSELKLQRGLVIPLVAMNFTSLAKVAITTAFLGRLGELQLAGGTLGFTFANVTGFSVLNGLCCAMEPICGQAYGARNFKLIHKTLSMAFLLLLLVSLPISALWLNADKILIYFGQQEDISSVAKKYLFYLLPDLVLTSFLCPLKAYLSSQSMTLPIMFSTALGLCFHILTNILLAKAKGLAGVSMAFWITDLIIVISLAIYVVRIEHREDQRLKEGGWWDQELQDWVQLLKFSGTFCLTTCLEWWCFEILVLLTGHLRNAKEAVGVLAIVFNFDYLLYSVMQSLATCASTRVSNELGANQPTLAYQSAYVSLSVSVASGCIGTLAMVAARGIWGPLYSHDKGTIRSVKKMLLLMALAELVNFPVAVCGGILRGTAKMWLALYAYLGGFYLVALPLGVIFAFKVGLGLGGLLLGFLVGMAACLILLLIFVLRISWNKEAENAQKLASHNEKNDSGNEKPIESNNSETP